MKKVKKILCIMLTVAMVLGCSLISFATEGDAHKLPIVHDHLVETMTRGVKKPSSSAGTVNLTQNDYSYDITKIGYRVYTNKWITGASSINVSVLDWKLIEEHPGAEKSKLTIAVYDASDKVVAKNTMDINWAHDNTGYGTMTLSGLNANLKYYVLFEVPTNSNSYSFNGTIEKE